MSMTSRDECNGSGLSQGLIRHRRAPTREATSRLFWFLRANTQKGGKVLLERARRGQHEGGAIEDKAEGRMKEAYGAITGDEEKKAEGRAQQRKGQAGEEAAQRAKTRRAEKEAKEAERERDRQKHKGKGPLGTLGDTLSGR